MLQTFPVYTYLLKRINSKHIVLILLFCFSCQVLFSQTTETPSATTEQQLENMTANNGDTETEDDSYIQQMEQFRRHPVNLNTADEGDIRELKMLSPIQVQSFILYRDLFGRFINIYELQAIPNWDIATIEKLRPYISVGNEVILSTTIRNRLKGGEHSILARVSQTLEKSKGFLIDSSTASNFYPGSPQKILARYQYRYKHLLQYGILGEKDAGEQFYKGRQKQGFDFYSAHFFARDIGIIKSMALGDFTVNLGQGLTQWQSLAFKKSAAVMNIKRESSILRPYNSAGEINFHRGAGITVAKNKWSATAFISRKKIDGNLVTDTSQNHEDFISSLQTSGYHRTKNEADDKGVQQQLVFGGNLSYQYGAFHFGINGVKYKFKLPLNKSSDPYNLYALSGKTLGNYSIDYSYTFKNAHLFGEAATNEHLHKAFLAGVLISAAPDVDISFLYRNISKSYQSLYTNAFTENTYPVNEKGLYTGVSLHPGNIWQIDAYADFYQFPWLKFGVDAPSNGSSYLMQLTCKPNKQLEIYSRFRSETKGSNFNPEQFALNQVDAGTQRNWRTEFIYKLNTELELSNRMELVSVATKTPPAEQGFLVYTNVLYKPMSKAWSFSARWQYFQTDSYNSRIYAYENDVMYSYSIPVFYDKGLRYYLNANYAINKKFIVWARYARTRYKNRTLIGSGLDEIKGSVKSDLRLQVTYEF